MTPEQEGHIADIIDNFSNNAYLKYKAGQKEHGGNLWELSELQLVTDALNEAYDQVIYLTTLKRRILNRTSTEANAK